MCAFLALLCWSVTAQAQPYTDLLIIVDPDGLGYTAQLTVYAEEEMIINRVPAERNNLETFFAGSGSELYQRAFERNPDKLSVISGSVFTRFQHQFSIIDNSSNYAQNSIVAPVFRANLDDFVTTMADAQSLSYRVSWILPDNIELFDYGTTASEDELSTGEWQKQGNMVIFEQNGGAPSPTWLEYRVHSGSNTKQACLASVGPSEWCSPDSDNDSVPDYRDMCISPSTTSDDEPAQQNRSDVILADKAQSGVVVGTLADVTDTESLGCEDDSRIVLSSIQFENGQTYLNASARATLDKLAIALKRLPENHYRIASYTDNAGYVRNNQQLSEDRAAAIRHYLMLHGVSPNQVKARGYGEAQPAHDNATAEGRRKNRRVELQLLN